MMWSLFVSKSRPLRFGTLRLLQKQFAKAIPDPDMALKLDPSVEAHTSRGRVQFL